MERLVSVLISSEFRSPQGHSDSVTATAGAFLSLEIPKIGIFPVSFQMQMWSVVRIFELEVVSHLIASPIMAGPFAQFFMLQAA